MIVIFVFLSGFSFCSIKLQLVGFANILSLHYKEFLLFIGISLGIGKSEKHIKVELIK